MDISRRTFLKASVTGGLAVSALGFDLRPAHAAVRQLKIRNATEYRTVCPYCAVGCGTIAYVHGSGGLNTKNTVIHVEGDPGQPHQRRHALPEGRVADGARHQPAVAAPAAAAPGGRGRVGRGRLGHGDGLVRAQVQGLARRLVPRAGRRRSGRQPRRRRRMGSAAPPSRTRTPTSSRRRCAPWAWSTSTTRPAYDTAPRWPVWPPRSAAGR